MEWKEISVGDDNDDEGIDLEKSPIECICPKCGLRHHLCLYWVGRGVPRKYCRTCRNLAKNTQLDRIFTFGMHLRE